MLNRELTYKSYNLAPNQFIFWTPPPEQFLHVGPNQNMIPLPSCPLPIKRSEPTGFPSVTAIGEGVYEYLRRFPDCENNKIYAEILRDAFPHYLADLGANAVLLDAKDVEPAYIVRKLTALKILSLLDPQNQGLLIQLCDGFYKLALTFSELSECHQNLVNAIRYGQELLKHDPANQSTLQILAEIDMLYCDYPAALLKWRQLKSLSNDPKLVGKVDKQIAKCLASHFPEKSLVEELEAIGTAMQLYSAKNYDMAVYILERIEQDEYLMDEFSSADFYCLLGMSRMKAGDLAGAHEALHRALDIDPGHQLSIQSLENI
ncbi:MAG: tetratricopeptide repeat protein [Deltaproteobacteria bacterium]|jgi:tetratricopeptide (TPR) repeat protein|nr:tetratricopeptide repeat protein [Deltaproteobacteria bacterium]MBW2520312.1 tetratricopeptide repeat protein [Deltaproteobacteria bacterium]